MSTQIRIPEPTKARARTMRANGWSWRRIAQYLHLNPKTIRSAIDPEYADRRARYDKAASQRRRHINSAGSVSRIEVPDDVIADRDARTAAPRTLTEELMGDPPPSRSALAQKQDGIT